MKTTYEIERLRKNNKYTIITSGSYGWIGGQILLASAKKNVISIARKSKIRPINQLEIIADLAKENASKVLYQQFHDQQLKADAFIHCAGLAHLPIETPDSKQKFYDANVNGTKQAVDFCKSVGIRRFVYVSSISPYDWENNKSSLSEDSPMSPQTQYAETKLEAEQIVKDSGLDWRIARLATVFGNGDKANFLKLSDAIKKGRFILPGNGGARKSVIPIDMAAHLLCEFAKIDCPKHRVLNLALPQTPMLRNIADAFTAMLGTDRCRSLPIPIFKLLATAGDALNLIKPFPLTTSTLKKLTTSTWVDTKRMQETFPKFKFHSFSHYMNKCGDYYRNT